MFSNRYKFILNSPLGELELKTDPMGWEDTETEIGRSEKTYGIFLTVSNNLMFTGDAKDYLENCYQIYGVQAEVRLTKYVVHPQTNDWQLSFTGFLDFSTRSIEANKLKIDFVEGGIREILTSQMREKFEINRLEAINGTEISTLETDVLGIAGRNIYLRSQLSSEGQYGASDTTEFLLKNGSWESGDDLRTCHRPAPLNMVANADPLNIATPFEELGTHGQHREASAATKFFVIADRDRGLTKVKIKVDFTISEITSDDVDSPAFWVVFKRYSGGDSFVIEDEIYLLEPINPFSNIGESFSLEYETEIIPLEGESFGVYFASRGAFGGGGLPGDSGHMTTHLSDYSGSIVWEEDSFFEPTQSKFITAFDLGKRLSEVLTGGQRFVSTTLQNDFWEKIGFTCGGWLRNLKDELETTNEAGEVVNTEEIEWALTMSFEDYYRSLHAIEPMGYGIVTKGAKQFIAMERLRYFFQNVVTIQLGQVSKVKRSTTTDFIFSSMDFGYEKGGNYEEPLGLDEYNTKTTFTTPITRSETKYEALGASRADSYGVEDARRMQFENYPDEDTPYDKDNFLIDAKYQSTAANVDYYSVRLWNDDFEFLPTGVYSPETAFNLNLSPARNMLRHAYFWNAATVKHPTDKIRFANSEGNSQLKTKIEGENEVKENQDTLISEFPNPIFEPEYVEFEYPFTQETLDQLQGQTLINGELVNNYYGLVEFINEYGNTEKGFLFSAKIKKTIKFKVLKTYGSNSNS